MMVQKPVIDIHHVEPKHRAIHSRLVNWSKWARGRRVYQTSPMFRMYRSNYRQWHPVHISDSIDAMDGMAIGKAVAALPAPHRRCMVWFYIHQYGENKFRREEGYTLDFLYQIIRDGRQMLVNRLDK